MQTILADDKKNYYDDLIRLFFSLALICGSGLVILTSIEKRKVKYI